MIIPDPKDVSKEEYNLNTYAVELTRSDDPDLIKSEIGAAPSNGKRRRTSKDSYIAHPTILDAGPLEDLVPAQETTEIALGEEEEAIETRKFYDFGKYCQKKSQHSKLSGELKEIAKGNHPVKVSFGKINLGRKDPKATIGHMIAYFATPENVWYIDLQQIESGKGQAVYDSIENIVRFFDPQVTKKKDGQDPFNPTVFYIPVGPQFGGYGQGEKSK